MFKLAEKEKPKDVKELIKELSSQSTQILSNLNSIIISMGELRDNLKSFSNTISKILEIITVAPPVQVVTEVPTPPPSKEEILPTPTPTPPKPPQQIAPEAPTPEKVSAPPTPSVPPEKKPPTEAKVPALPTVPPTEVAVTEAEKIRQRNILITHELGNLVKLAQSGTLSGKTLAEKILETRDKIQQVLPYSPVYHEMLMLSQRMKSFGDGTPDSSTIMELLTRVEEWKKRLIK